VEEIDECVCRERDWWKKEVGEGERGKVERKEE